MTAEWIPLGLPYGYNGYNGSSAHRPESFASKGLNEPGTQVRMADGSTYLIGDINQNRGVCDDCVEFDADTIVEAYRVLVTKEMMS